MKISRSSFIKYKIKTLPASGDADPASESYYHSVRNPRSAHDIGHEEQYRQEERLCVDLSPKSEQIFL